jgi:fucose permease
MLASRFARNRFTWLSYLMLGYYAYMLNIFGPAIPFLRAEMTLSYTVASLHLSAFAVGLLLAGLTADAAARGLGRPRLFWGAALGMTLCSIPFMLGTHPAVTIGAALLMGTLGSYLLAVIPAMLSDHYGELRAVAFSEANVVAGFLAGLAPVAVGVLAGTLVGWRGVLWLAMAALAGLAVLFGRVPMPVSRGASGFAAVQTPRLPAAYWLYWLNIVLVVSVEFCAVSWAPTFLETVVGLARADAAAWTGVFLLGMVLGRAAGSGLVRRFPSTAVVLGAIGLSGIGYLLHWWFAAPWPSVGGLFLAGLGTGNLYPLTLSLAVGAAVNQSDAATARASLASGLAILFLPLLLGGLADAVGLRTAYSVVFGLLALAAVVIVGAQRLTRRSSRPLEVGQP